MSLLPAFAVQAANTSTKASESVEETPREFGIDFETGKFTGAIVEGLEAIKVWIYLALHIERYRFPIYSWQYGVELDQYIGHSYSQEYLDTDVREAVKECLLQNPHIKSIQNFTASIKGDKFTMSFTVETDIGGIDIDV